MRKALGDIRQPFHLIATVPRRGYRFLTPVTEDTGAVEQGVVMRFMRDHTLWVVWLGEA